MPALLGVPRAARAQLQPRHAAGPCPAASRARTSMRPAPAACTWLQVSYLEIYNEQLYDLLSETPGNSDSLAVLEDSNGMTYVGALHWQRVCAFTPCPCGMRHDLMRAVAVTPAPLTPAHPQQSRPLHRAIAPGHQASSRGSKGAREQGREGGRGCTELAACFSAPVVRRCAA